MLSYRFFADAVVIFHALYVGTIVFGLLAIWIGLAARWRWARNFWIRTVHLAMIAVVAVEAVAGVICPLTSLEKHFRQLGGEQVYAGSFLGDLAHNLLFFDAPQWIFSLAHCLFGVLVLLTYVAAPPRWPGRRPRQRDGSQPQSAGTR